MYGSHYKHGAVSSAFRLPAALALMTEYMFGCQITCSMRETVQGHMYDPSLTGKRGTSHNTTSKCIILDQETQTENKFPSSWNA